MYSNDSSTPLKRPERKSVKLKYYDYSREGLYFLTVCTNEKKHLFGKIDSEIMYKNKAGHMVEAWLLKVQEKFDNVKITEFQVMPNHIHCIVEILNTGVKSKPSNSLFDMVQWYKSMTTNEYIKKVKEEGWPRFEKKLWQRSFYDHIIKTEEDFGNTVLYIRTNPENWDKDKCNT